MPATSASNGASVPKGVGDPRAPLGPYGEPAFIFVYGPPGSGKSVDAAKCYGESALYLRAPSGGLEAIVANLKFRPKDVAVKTLFDVHAVFSELQKLAASGKNPYRAVVFDDASVLCKNTILAIEGSGEVKTRSGDTDTLRVFLHLAKAIEITRYLLREIGMFGLLNFHDREPSVDKKGMFHKGGPNLGTVGQTEALIPIIDVVVRARLESGRLPWGGFFECKPDSDPNWAYKDRYSVVPSKGPLNTAEILRAAGFYVPHPAPWMSEMVHEIAGAVIAGGDRLKVYATYASHLLNQKVPEHIVQWVCQDGLDRAELQMVKRAETLARMGLRVDGAGTFTSARG